MSDDRVEALEAAHPMTPAPPPYDHLRRLVEARIRKAMWLGAVLGFVVGLVLGVLL